MARKPVPDKDRQDEEFKKLLALFHELIESIKEEGGHWSDLEDLITERADIGMRYAFDGFGISYDDALDLIKKQDDLTDAERVDRDILVAAVDNIIDFSTVEEYQMARQIPYFDGSDVSEPDFESGEESFDDFLDSLCDTYNRRYSNVENMDIEFAMIVAAYLSKIGDDTILTYMTQGDDRVRPWHLQFEGFSAPRSKFPSWLIPPIEHGCRCFLVEDSASTYAKIKASRQPVPEMPEWFDRTFKESVANGGRIFSDEHPYFQVGEKDYESLRGVANRIKQKYLWNGQ